MYELPEWMVRFNVYCDTISNVQLIVFTAGSYALAIMGTYVVDLLF
jgi:hypothetical protein